MRVFALAVLAAALTGCEQSNQFGPCVGAFDDKDPALVYKLSDWNLTIGLIFVALIAPPILVITNETFCPVGVKPILRSHP